MTESDRQRLAAAVSRRRHELRLTQEDVAARAGLRTRRTVQMVEQAKPVKKMTLAKLDHGLGWKHGSCENLLIYGEEPVPLGADVRDISEYTDPDERAIASLHHLPWETRQALIDVLRQRKGNGDRRNAV
jgi:transcriptional regulator with XRE-family HTH domain